MEKAANEKERDKKGLFFVEGFHLVEEALKTGIVTELIVSDQTDLPKDWTVNDVEMYIVPEAIVKYFVKQKRRKVYLLFVRSMRKK